MSKVNRRHILAFASALTLSTVAGAKPFKPLLGPRARVLIVNDIGGDLDGLYSTVHAILSPSTDVRGIVGTLDNYPGNSAERAVELAEKIVSLMGLEKKMPVHRGADSKLHDINTPIRSAGANAIIAEAKRTDTDLPLFVTAGGGLTDVASALLMAPEIAEKFTLVWIGGTEHNGANVGETNYKIDPLAAQIVFNNPLVSIWQVPSNVYANCQVSLSELQMNVAPFGKIGKWLYETAVNGPNMYGKGALNTGETWNLGDNPLVLLSALTGWGPDGYERPFKFTKTQSSTFEEVITPKILPSGAYEPQEAGRKMRLYTGIDTRLMLDDFFAKMQMNYGR